MLKIATGLLLLVLRPDYLLAIAGGVDDAVRNGIAKASQTLRNLDWFEVKEIRGHLEEGKIADWQVTIKIGFRLEDG